MSDLIAIAYPDRPTAERVRSTLMRLTTEHAIELEDAVVVDRDERGKVKLHQMRRGTPDKVLPRIAEFGGEIIQTSLDPDQEDHLKAALGENVATS